MSINFETLFPKEVSIYVFSFLDATSLGRCAQVCKKWCQLTSEDSLWKPEFTKIIKNFVEPYIKLHPTFNVKIPQPESYKVFLNKYAITTLPMFYDRLQRFVNSLEFMTMGVFNCFFSFSKSRNPFNRVISYDIKYKIGIRSWTVEKGLRKIEENFYFIGKCWTDEQFRESLAERFQEYSTHDGSDRIACFARAFSEKVPLCLISSEEIDHRGFSYRVKAFLKTVLEDKLNNKSIEMKKIIQNNKPIESVETRKSTRTGLKRKRD